jgi:hypothetical protein
MAVVFQLVCLSRLGATPILSTLVLFLTLVVFTGPLLNAWLMIADNICVRHSPPEKIVMMIAFIGAHAAGAVSAGGIVAAFSKDEAKSAKSMLFWKTPEKVAELKDLGLDDWQLVNHFFDELFGVTSLLIGCVYLLWLKEMRRAKPLKEYETYPKIEITFYFHLTLLVTAASQAFPSAYLSPHVLFYKLFMQKIPSDVFWARLGGGGVGLGIACVWRLLRVKYRDHIQDYLDPEHDHTVALTTDPTVTTKAYAYSNVVSNDTMKERMPGFRLSMHGGSYF